MNAILIGRLLKPFGLKGQIKAVFYVDDFKDLKGYSVFYKADKKSPEGYSEIKFDNIYENLGNINLTVSGCSDRTAAEALRGIDIYVDGNELPALEKDVYYIRDLEDCKVYENDKATGVVKNVFETAAKMYLQISLDRHGEIAVPFTGRYVDKVDIKEKSITLRNIEELL